MTHSNINLSILSLVTSKTSFYRQQEKHLKKRGVDIDTLTVSGKQVVDGGPEESRSYYHYLKALFEFHRHYTHSDYDVVHANFGLTAPIALSQFSTPVVMTLWGTDLMGKYGTVTKICAERCDAVMVRSKEMEEMLPCSAQVVPSGVDLDLFRPLPMSEARRRIGWSDEEHQVLFPYSPDYTRKNYPLAERIVEEVNKDLEKEVNLKTISDVPHEKVPVYMNASDAILLTSSREGSPNTVKEAMACNIPVITTNVGDVEHRLQNVTNTYVSNNEKELISGLKHVLISGERTNGREEVREVSWENIARIIIKIYQRLAN